MNFLAGLTAEKRRERLDQLFRLAASGRHPLPREELEPFLEMRSLQKRHG